MSQNNSKNYKTPKKLDEIEGMVPHCPNCDGLFNPVQPANADILCPYCKQVVRLTIFPKEEQPATQQETENHKE